MKLDGRYEVRVVVFETAANGIHIGDCYDSYEKFKKEKPFSDYDFGYIVFDTQTGLVPDKCNDWNDSVLEAIYDWQDNCCAEKESADKKS